MTLTTRELDTGRDDADGFVPAAALPAPIPLVLTTTVAAAASLLAIILGDASVLLPVALGGILGATVRRGLRLVVMLTVATVAHAATAAVLAATLDIPAPAITLGWTTAGALLLVTMATAVDHRTTSVALVGVAAGGIAVALTAVAIGSSDTATLGIDIWAAIAILATIERVLAVHLGRAGDPQATTRAALLGLLLTPTLIDAILLRVLDRPDPALMTAVATTIALLAAFGIALRREGRIARRAGDLESLTSLFVESEDRGIIAVGPDGTILSANRVANEMLAGPGGAIVGVNVDAFLPTGRADRHRADRARFRASQSTRPMSGAGPVTARTLDGREVVLRIALRTISGDDERIMGVIDDLSARRAEADALRMQLERQRGVVDQLRRLESLRTGLLTAASHELRTPVTVLHGTAELLSARHDALDSETITALLTRQHEQSRKLVRLLDDLVAMDPDSVPETHPRSLPLDRAVKDVVNRWSRRNDGQVVHVLAHPTTGWIDPALLERIIEILLDNCRIHGASPIAVQVRSNDRGGLITVSDSGAGIPRHLHDEIFQPFGRGASVDFANPGLGLGLPLARMLAEADGGTLIAVPSSHGATLELRVPTPPLQAASTIGLDGSFVAMGGGAGEGAVDTTTRPPVTSAFPAARVGSEPTEG